MFSQCVSCAPMVKVACGGHSSIYLYTMTIDECKFFNKNGREVASLCKIDKSNIDPRERDVYLSLANQGINFNRLILTQSMRKLMPDRGLK